MELTYGERGFLVETEWCFLPERSEVMVDVTGIYGDDLNSVLAEIGVKYSWTGVTFETCRLDGEVSEWMCLLGATKCSTG